MLQVVLPGVLQSWGFLKFWERSSVLFSFKKPWNFLKIKPRIFKKNQTQCFFGSMVSIRIVSSKNPPPLRTKCRVLRGDSYKYPKNFRLRRAQNIIFGALDIVNCLGFLCHCGSIRLSRCAVAHNFANLYLILRFSFLFVYNVIN